MKTWQDNNVTYRTSVVYTKNDTEFLWPIECGRVYEKNQTR